MGAVIAADFTPADIGAVVCFPVGEINVVGTLAAISYPFGMVRLVLEDDGKQQAFTVDREKNITITTDHARFRAVTEPDTELRGRFLHEINHNNVLRLLDDVLNGERP